VRRNTGISTVDSDFKLIVPPLQQSLVINKVKDNGAWHEGRVKEMLYRDLIPGRQGGRFIASCIRILNGGKVDDPVHFHRIRFQMIYCYKGWVRLAYEDQGDQFTMQAGDCVLQPPEIRHQVKESSSGLEVIEICCPADHWTFYDYDLRLPTSTFTPERAFSGQRFVSHEAAKARWQPWRTDGFEARDLGIAAATGGIAGANVVRPSGMTSLQLRRYNAELLFMFVLHGSLDLHYDETMVKRLAAGDSVVVPAGMPHSVTPASPDLEFLEVTLPASLKADVF
jgi:mannose-6-phosphate isomerase-like protein (cupin superfamily)